MIKAVKKATDILIFLSDSQNSPVTLGQIAAHAGLNKATCSHLVSTLCETLMVQKVSRKTGYILGPQAYYLTRHGPYQQELIKICYPVLRWLFGHVQATVQLTVVCEGMKYIINTIEGDIKLLESGVKIKQDELYATATGRTILANMEEEEVEHIIAKVGPPPADQWPGIESLSQIQEELRKIRQAGYTFIKRANDPRRLGYSCAIKKSGKVVAAIGISINQDRVNDETHQMIIAKMKSAAREINRRLCFTDIGKESCAP